MKVFKKYFPLWLGLITILIIIILFAILGYAPFGCNSVARSDANVQYLDFFAYFKDILSGRAPVGYSFGKVLGGNNIGIISYYLLSPFNLLVVFFDKVELHSFIDIITALKIGLSACTMAFFLKRRFCNPLQHNNDKSYFIIALFGISYALSQWFISQSSNTMWLDGAYMLPLVLLGIYRLVQNKKIRLLSITAGLSIIFNWYSGGINCIFSFIWLLFETFNRFTKYDKKVFIKTLINNVALYCLAMLLALAISAIIFLPTIEVMGGTNRGQLELKALFDPSFRGNILSAIQTYGIGATSSEAAVTLFCGSLTLIGVVGCFITKQFKSYKKTIYCILLIVLLLCFYWNPGFMLFSLLKSANSFWYRYAYVAVFALIFMATDFFINGQPQKIKNSIYVIIASVYSLSILLLNYINPEITNIQYVYYSILFFFLVTLAVILLKTKTTKYVFLTIIVVIELICSTIIQFKKYHTEDVSSFQEYAQLTNQQIEEIKTADNDYYRISQTATRNLTNDNLTANYNEPLAYNYWSLSGYTSNPDEKQMEFLDKVGYMTGSVNMNIVNTSLLGVDSLIGVKYILSPYYINGLQKTNFSNGYNNKKVYYNPYALPIAFKFASNNYNTETETWTGVNSINSFEYQNRLFKKITNTNNDIYKSINHKLIKDSQSLTYSLDIPHGNYAIYANIPWYAPIPAKLNMNNVYETGYAMWLSPSALYVPTNPNNPNAIITIQTPNPDSFKIGEEQFYALDLDLLQKISTTLTANKPETSIIENGYAYFELSASQGEYLFTSIPVDKNWTIMLNDQIINPELFADTFYAIPLVQGKNIIKMSYKVKTVLPGTIISSIAIIGIATTSIYGYLRKRTTS